jgi:hypothetical protein
MLRAPIRVLFCLASAVLGAAIGDVSIERASTAGWFGTGRYTDGSTADILPALVLGLLVAAFIVAFRAYASLQRGHAARSLLHSWEEALSCGTVRLLPLAFAFQIAVLFVMETAEQFVVWHHSLGGTVWLGGPIAVSLCVHLAICTIVLCTLATVIRALASSAVLIIGIVSMPVRSRARNDAPLVTRTRNEGGVAYRPIFAYASIGQRGPPAPLHAFLLAALGEFVCLLVGQFVLRFSSRPPSPALP